MSARERAVTAARAAVGVKYRLHGRDPQFGVDCVGLAGLALRAAGCTDAIPAGYALRGGTADAMLALIDRGSLVRTDHPIPGDLLLFAAGPAQFHLAIMAEDGIYHADAMLRRVVERPGTPPWPLVAAWALIEDALTSDLLRGEG
ncbi:peptidoglycan endopeptidase [Sphingomonas qilianensis]|uniref:Peptidoglycan endopeptidase n=1 Tax=Sphingomonas qilianensis TaxID=1736690 RepID=A0ABU9XRN0_9SPHN